MGWSGRARVSLAVTLARAAPPSHRPARISPLALRAPLAPDARRRPSPASVALRPRTRLYRAARFRAKTTGIHIRIKPGKYITVLPTSILILPYRFDRCRRVYVMRDRPRRRRRPLRVICARFEDKVIGRFAGTNRSRARRFPMRPRRPLSGASPETRAFIHIAFIVVRWSSNRVAA